MNILITGASGYIGSRLTKKLANNENHIIRCLARQPENIQNRFEKVCIINCANSLHNGN